VRELTILDSFEGCVESDRAGMRDTEMEGAQDEEEALRLAERLVAPTTVAGWPSRNTDPTLARSFGRFVKAHPLDFPMGVADLHEEPDRT
jgi:hypothetical protein